MKAALQERRFSTGPQAGGTPETVRAACKAVLRRGSTEPADWLDLNDKHFVHGTSGWVLREATAINNTGHIVGQGTLNGSTRGFVLIRRTAGN